MLRNPYQNSSRDPRATLRGLPQLVVLFCAAAIMAGVNGCAARVPQREAGASLAFGGDQASASESVFMTPETVERLDAMGERDNARLARRDQTLSFAGDGPLLATNEWPTPARASLERARHVYVRDREGRVTFFVPDRRDDRTYRHWSNPWSRD